ncbi:amidohydrolase family protein [Hirsutella rhossiliensis]|uniref:Amidohydrolase family domain-containing protein n=1 Tax=Hirsutella rhossiliensis TaxID=111463 RepID=A0A9P8MS32_9HYPO|nr:amidohydrolase family domain-containing protein [Hirsutella rhossiliensis]KAH0959444.1 amidohydrolase family domain-containing protein [Hirsutella rhossiliensis]
MPGIHDAHVHVMVAGLSQLSTANLGLEEAIPASEAAGKLKTAACGCQYAHAFSNWLVADAYHIDDFDRSCLDEAYPDTPIMIRAAAGHSLLLNTVALQESGYDISNEPPAKGSYLGRRLDGSLTGEVAELGMTKALISYPKPNLFHVKRAVQHAVCQLHKAGVTSCQEASANTPMLQALGQLDGDNQLKMDLYTHIVYAPEHLGEEPASQLHKLLDSAELFKTKHVNTQFVKIMLDGVPLAPYYTHAGLSGKNEVDEDKICVDDVVEAVARALDAIEAARKRNPGGPRHEIAHCSGVHDDDYSRFRALNTTAEMSPSIFFTHSFSPTENALMDWNFPRMLSHNAHITIGSDWGVTEPPSLFPGVEGIVPAVGNGDRAKGATTLLRMLTLSGAEAVGREEETGSIQVGKRANFIQVDRDLSIGREGAFRDAKVQKTWFEGEVVFEASTRQL